MKRPRHGDPPSPDSASVTHTDSALQRVTRTEKDRGRERPQDTVSGRRRWCVAVHVGAGYHKPELEAQWRATLSAACAAAATVLNEAALTGSEMAAQNDFVPAAMRAVTAALASLEDDASTNAGLGSNLTEGGHVEADARCVSNSFFLMTVFHEI